MHIKIPFLSFITNLDNPVPAPTEGDRPNPLRPTRNWDAIAKEADSIEEGDPLQNLFSKIYKDASEDTRKAMEKSFVSCPLLDSKKFIEKDQTLVL